MTYNRVSLKQKNGAPRAKSSLITLIPYDDIVTWPARTEDDILVTGNVTLATNALAIGMYATVNTISRVDTQEGDPDAEGFLQTISFDHPGNSLEFETFVQKWLGKPFIVISDECGDDNGRRLHGWKCNPVFFTAEGQDNNEAVKTKLNFTTRLRTRFKSAYYKGTMPALAPDATGSSNGGV
ncbi:hypothetical protein ACR79T_10155 [Sphingobacterium spiritivorum]|uniref:hypothetical protein n=1 Tax=Sphingobacterium spiritivorum TaxID=258 RepID=UPI003DA61BB5